VRDARPLLVGGPHLLPGGVAQPAARRREREEGVSRLISLRVHRII
jgi:hypothetical protein